MKGLRLLLTALAAGLIGLAAKPVLAETVYFVVGEWPGQEIYGDSYVVPIQRPLDIQHARDLITLGPEAVGDPIVVAAIEAGADGINRDWLAPGAPEWSWHVTEFQSFAFATIEILDGYPTFVESDVAWWIENTNQPSAPEMGYIGFWGYTIIAELPPVPELPVPSLTLACLASCLMFFRVRKSLAQTTLSH
ncbi:MAG: hypothetical protein JW889_14290 [Verrucomicrobia bacterium]|nr:hypothetical protein [Verrucomicrobiota bacterium]